MLQHIIDSAKLLRPETALATTFCLLLLADLFIRRKSNATAWLALVGLSVTGFFVAQQAAMMGAPISIFTNMFAVDAFSIFFKVVILAASGVIVLFSLQSNELQLGTRRLGEYYALLISLTLGMFLMTGASNLLMMYLSLELTSLSSYILAGYTKDAEDSSEASLKYIIYGAVSSGMMLYGISILYGLTGAVDIYGVQHALMLQDVNTLALIIAGILIVAGFGYKISAAPFHFWTPDVYEGAPITITAFLSVASKAAGFAMMIRFFTVSFLDVNVSRELVGSWAIFQGFEWNRLLAILSVLTMTLGNLAALGQRNLKRLLAYSSIAHAGYMLLGVVVLSNQGLAAVLIYFVVYFFMNLGAFYLVMLVANKTGSEEIDEYRGLGYRSPLISVAMTIFLLSLTGIPPTAGFVGKLYLFAALINAKMIWLAVVGALNSVVSLYYYVRVLRNMFLRDAGRSTMPISLSIPQIVLLLALLAPVILLGIYFGPLVEYAQASVTMFGVH
ncbi:MAG: NADH-quinone oxidoreductase subunit N [Ignavibacteriae bacterium]|nr:NADH-quinone oxidoreductase subunit N [Ignavibacteria bacterium]MBI3363966.1 NADH-quinone oxidoreductase subunit N [Ignavibacteriota bacterium]